MTISRSKNIVRGSHFLVIICKKCKYVTQVTRGESSKWSKVVRNVFESQIKIRQNIVIDELFGTVTFLLLPDKL